MDEEDKVPGDKELRDDGSPKQGIFNAWTPADFIVGMLAAGVTISILGALFIPHQRVKIIEGGSKEYIAVLGTIMTLITAHIMRREGKD